MKGYLFDAIAMGIVSLLVYLYLDRGIEALIAFAVGFISLRELRRIISIKLQK